MKRKSINKIILTLSLTLAITTYYTIDKYIDIKEQQKVIPLSTKDETDLISKEVIIKKLNNENQMLVLSGEAEVEVTYSNKDIAEDDVNFKWLKNWFSEIKSKDLNINATYTYKFYYDLKNLDIEIINDSPRINLSKNRLSCDVSLTENKTIFTDRIGLLESHFTPNEINSVNARTKDLVLNEVQNNNKLRNKAMKNLQNNIEDLLNKKCDFILPIYDVVENNSKELKNVKYLE